MKPQEIEQYLAKLGEELKRQGITKPVRMLLIGGAYMMLLANAPRTTDDIDMFWVEEGEDFHKARLALRDGVQTIASKHTLPPNWFNYSHRCSSMIKLSCRKANCGNAMGRCMCMSLPQNSCSR